MKFRHFWPHPGRNPSDSRMHTAWVFFTWRKQRMVLQNRPTTNPCKTILQTMLVAEKRRRYTCRSHQKHEKASKSRPGGAHKEQDGWMSRLRRRLGDRFQVLRGNYIFRGRFLSLLYVKTNCINFFSGHSKIWGALPRLPPRVYRPAQTVSCTSIRPRCWIRLSPPTRPLWSASHTCDKSSCLCCHAKDLRVQRARLWHEEERLPRPPLRARCPRPSCRRRTIAAERSAPWRRASRLPRRGKRLSSSSRSWSSLAAEPLWTSALAKISAAWARAGRAAPPGRSWRTTRNLRRKMTRVKLVRTRKRGWNWRCAGQGRGVTWS